MSETNGNGNVWKILSGLGLIVSLIAAIFSAGYNFAQNNNNGARIDNLQTVMERDYSRRGEVDLRFIALQEQLSRIERAVVP